MPPALPGALFTFVRDHGKGIRPEDLEHIFDIFYTIGDYAQFNKKGVGIGLAIVKRLVKKLKGSIKVVSEPGVGSTFEVLIRK